MNGKNVKPRRGQLFGPAAAARKRIWAEDRSPRNAEHPARRPCPRARQLSARLYRRRHAKGRQDPGGAEHPAGGNGARGGRPRSPGSGLPATAGEKKAGSRVRWILRDGRLKHGSFLRMD